MNQPPTSPDDQTHEEKTDEERAAKELGRPATDIEVQYLKSFNFL